MISSTQLDSVGTVTSRKADEIVGRLERLPFSRFHLHLAAVLGVGTFFDAFDSTTLSVALAVVFTSLHIGFVNAGFLLSAAFVGQFVGAIVFGYLSELRGRKFAFVWSLACFGVLAIAASLAANYQSLLVIRLIQGIGLGAEVPVAAALFNEYVGAASRGRVVILYNSVFAWGLLLAPLTALLFFKLVGPNLGWRLLFAVGGIPLLVAIYGAFKLPESARWLADKGRYEEADRLVRQLEAERPAGELPAPEIRYRADVEPTRFGELFSPAYVRRTIVAWTLWFAAFFIVYGYSGWLPALYVSIGGLPATSAVVLTAGLGCNTLFWSYVVAFLIDRVGRRPLFIAGFAINVAGALIGLVCTALLHLSGWPVLFASALVLNTGSTPITMGVIAYTPELYPTRMRAWATSAASSMNRVASFIGPTIVGALLAAKLGIGSVFAMLLVLAALGLTVFTALGIETKRQVLEELSA